MVGIGAEVTVGTALVGTGVEVGTVVGVIVGKEFKRFLLIALGSSDEVISHLRTLQVIYPEMNLKTHIDNYVVLSKRVNSLHKNWRVSD